MRTFLLEAELVDERHKKTPPFLEASVSESKCFEKQASPEVANCEHTAIQHQPSELLTFIRQGAQLRATRCANDYVAKFTSQPVFSTLLPLSPVQFAVDNPAESA